MNRPVHFEFHAPDPEKAMEFYTKVFGWKFIPFQGGPEAYFLAMTGDKATPGIDGGLLKSRDGQARTVNTIGVESVDDYARKVEENGGKVVVPKMAIPGVGYLAFCTDPGGLIFGIMNEDTSAK